MSIANLYSEGPKKIPRLFATEKEPQSYTDVNMMGKAWPKIVKDCDELSSALRLRLELHPNTIPEHDTELINLSVENLFGLMPRVTRTAHGVGWTMRTMSQDVTDSEFKIVDGKMQPPEHMKQEARFIITTLGGLLFLESAKVPEDSKHPFGEAPGTPLQIPFVDVRPGHEEKDKQRISDYLRKNANAKNFVRGEYPPNTLYVHSLAYLDRGRVMNEPPIDFAEIALQGLRDFHARLLEFKPKLN